MNNKTLTIATVLVLVFIAIFLYYMLRPKDDLNYKVWPITINQISKTEQLKVITFHKDILVNEHRVSKGLFSNTEDKIYVGGAYDRWEILEQTPDKFVFKLEYDSLEVFGHFLHETITITAEAGKIYLRATSPGLEDATLMIRSYYSFPVITGFRYSF